MIRIDYKIQGEHVLTTWVHENGDQHSMMGRITFTKEQWRHFHFMALDEPYIFEEKQ